ncbi:GntR family transcriptional regulator [Halomonas denitrificans]|uniref:GntR family transcriptional regulator n=1 Tax=Halomonas denitrificans TaxID=370769 RepID=UPI001C98F43F|nr:GntR family transcriptional regulator [Halomonas denitrificans]MBY5968383.1 GntR family transcriptional regulator [Halomonas denitrificans]
MSSTKSRGASTQALALEACYSIKRLGLVEEEHLPEARLCELLKVSRTPVRSALALLSDEKVLIRRPNRGFFLSDSQALERFISRHATESSEDSLPALSFTLALDYLNGDLGPELQEAELARAYEVSRQQAQQALSAMEREGWMTRRLGYGFEFNATLSSPESYDQCYRYRILIEPAALLEPTFKTDPAVMKRLRQQQQALLDGKAPHRAGSMYSSGTEFHESLVGFSHNPFLLDGLQKANRLRRLIEYSLSRVRETTHRECEEHLELLELIDSGDLPRAAAFLERHLKRAREEKVSLVQTLLRQRLERRAD